MSGEEVRFLLCTALWHRQSYPRFVWAGAPRPAAGIGAVADPLQGRKGDMEGRDSGYEETRQEKQR
jgi:hypothetical protein